MHTHVMPEDKPQTVDFVITQMQCVCAHDNHLRTLHVMIPEMNTTIFADDFAGRFGYIMIQRGEEQQCAHGAVGIERIGKMCSKLLAVTS